MQISIIFKKENYFWLVERNETNITNIEYTLYFQQLYLVTEKMNYICNMKCVENMHKSLKQY